MTMPHEEYNTIRYKVKAFLNWLSETPMKDITRKELRKRCSSVRRHYPFDYQIEKMFSDRVCMKCENTKEFCTCKKVRN